MERVLVSRAKGVLAMPDDGSARVKTSPAPKRSGTIVLPLTATGRWGFGLTVLSFSLLLVVLPTVTMLFRETHPWTDSWIMPVIGVGILDVGAILNGVALFRLGDRSVLGIAAAVMSLPPALFATLSLAGGWITGI